MLALKFPVSFARRILNARSLARTSCPGEKISYGSKNSFGDKGNRCLEHKRALERCPKPSLVKRCREKFFPDNTPRSKCSWSNADDYRRAHQAIKARSEKLIELSETTRKTIVREIRDEILKIRCDENLFTKRILQSLEPRVLELSSLDPVCAMKKKHDVYMLNDRTQQELTNLHEESQLGIDSIECELESLHRELKYRAACALQLISSCRDSKSPQALILCIEHTSREASEILDKVKVDFDERIKNIKIAKEETIREDEKRIQDATKIYEKNMAKLIAQIVNCIRIMKLKS